MATDDDSNVPFDSNRRLCPDGSCIGVIGPSGRCGACGRTAEGDVAANVAAPRPSDELDADAGFLPDDEGDSGGGVGSFDPNRRLCSDGSCVGVIGADNRCGVCRKPG